MRSVPLAAPVPGFPGAAWAVTEIVDRSPDFLSRSERTLFDTLQAPKRRREWLAGRAAARSALRALGGGAASVLRTDEGAPRLEGPGAERLEVAITHGRNHAAAVAAPLTGPFPHLGIDWVDAEDRVRLLRIAKRVLSPQERAQSEADPVALQVAWGAREAVAKATRTGMFAFALHGVRVTALDAAGGTAELDLEGSLSRFWVRPEGSVIVVAAVSGVTRARAQRLADEARSRGSHPTSE
ncbi:MAG: 4'-phosphopantetheinyl transferase superfamily protein [Myxococcota bacterium]